MVDVQAANDKLVRRARRIVSKITGVDDAAAAELLMRADNNVKVAIVIQRRQVDAETARTLLKAVNGHLRKVIDE
jgi:N-acetylmuramic acid 6-phosphate etherase